MMKQNTLPEQQVFLFELEEKENSLKEFIYFLKFQGIRGVIDFSYSGGHESIHPNTSLKDNFILDSVPTSLIKNKEDNFRFRLTELKNQKINELIDALEPIERDVTWLDEEQIHLASIVKTLLSESKYIFLKNPDSKLSRPIFEKVKECIKLEVEINKRSVLIQAKDSQRWLDIATSFVTKDQNKNFQIKENISNKDFICSTEESKLKFQIINKAS